MPERKKRKPQKTHTKHTHTDTRTKHMSTHTWKTHNRKLEPACAHSNINTPTSRTCFVCILLIYIFEKGVPQGKTEETFQRLLVHSHTHTKTNTHTSSPFLSLTLSHTLSHTTAGGLFRGHWGPWYSSYYSVVSCAWVCVYACAFVRVHVRMCGWASLSPRVRILLLEMPVGPYPYLVVCQFLHTCKGMNNDVLQ